jgi:hypothetical protein
MSQPAGNPLPACCYAFATDVLRLQSKKTLERLVCYAWAAIFTPSGGKRRAVNSSPLNFQLLTSRQAYTFSFSFGREGFRNGHPPALQYSTTPLGDMSNVTAGK